MPRTIAIGDIHGDAHRLAQLLQQVKDHAQEGDTLVFIGDYIDRGSDSREVVEMVLATRAEWQGPVVCLRGNHEDMLLASLDEPASREYDEGLWEYNGGDETKLSYTSYYDDPWPGCLPESHLTFFRDLQLWHEDEHGIYVHAGLLPGLRPEEVDAETMVWIRDEFILSEHDWGKPVVFGHTPQFEADPEIQSIADIEQWRPLDWPEKIGIDTGVCYGGQLSAVILPDRIFLTIA